MADEFKVHGKKSFYVLGLLVFSACFAAEVKECDSDCTIKRALLGDGEAAYRIGNAYLYEDRAKMKYWYRISSENGDVNGQHNYAHFLVVDANSPEDCYRAMFWFKQAAKKGDKVSDRNYRRLEKAMRSGRAFEKGCSDFY